MIDTSKVKELVQLMVENDLTELDLKSGDESLSLRRGTAPGTVVNHQPVIYQGVPSAAAIAAPAAPGAPGAPVPIAAPPVPVVAEPGLKAIESPMVGTYFASPNPDAPAFVKPGSTIAPDSVVCLVEAMKVFNEIKAEISGVIERVLVKNGDPVEFGQKLFLVRPA